MAHFRSVLTDKMSDPGNSCDFVKNDLPIRKNPAETNNLSAPMKAKHKLTAHECLKNLTPQHLQEEVQIAKLLLAVSVNNTERVKRLLDLGVSPNSTDHQLRSGLHLAASKGYVEMVKLLLQHGADPNLTDIIKNTPLHLAACLNNLEIITLLLSAGANLKSLDHYGRTPLQLAESKLQLLQRSWKEGTIEMVQLISQLQTVSVLNRITW